jgi:hypothetical protein
MRRLLDCAVLMGTVLILTGFSLDNALVPKEEILSGGVPKDGIPAILEPKFIQAQNANFLKPDDKVIGVHLGGQAKAYPIRILNWHEVVNDAINGVPIVVTF